MQRLYIITGAVGHLASTIIKYLKRENCSIRGLILPTENGVDEKNIKYYKGDITKEDSLEEIFSNIEECEVIVLHTAGLISIASDLSPLLYNVNVKGTKNMIKQCMKHHVKRMVYVSSVHAIHQAEDMGVITEVKEFSADQVIGGYAKTKAEATQAVLNAVKEGLDAVIVHPSGILGPFDEGRNHLVQLIRSYISGKLTAGVTGGYDFVDVRDVAKGCIAAVDSSR